MDTEKLSVSHDGHGRLGAQQALSGGGGRVVSLLVGPERTQFLCNASLLSRHSPFLASLLSDRWSAAAPRNRADDAEGVAREGVARAESGETRDLGNEELDSLRATLDLLKVNIHTPYAHAASKVAVSSGNVNAAARSVSLSSFSYPPLVRQLQPLPVVRIPPGCKDPLLFEKFYLFSKFCLNLRHHAILCTICWARGRGLKSGNICGHGDLWYCCRF
ncbi:unnamed protein product [Closterium sp. Naga37s-1]|nr:unnamed protein product [Closterium sp. Naga37s-1]